MANCDNRCPPCELVMGCPDIKGYEKDYCSN